MSLSIKAVQALNHEQVQRQSITGILNCYLREYAIPHHQVTWQAKEARLPLTLRRFSAYPVLVIHFPELRAEMAIKVAYLSAIGKAQFVGRPWLKCEGSGWKGLNAQSTLQWLLHSLSIALHIDFNQELMAQLKNSLAITERFIGANLPNENQTLVDMGPPRNAFIDSEQSLLWGHAFHPTPKSRTGVPMDQMQACSPEVGAKVALFWFKVRQDLFVTQGTISKDKHPLMALKPLQPSQNTNSYPPQYQHGHNTADGYLLYPCHPWEAHTLLKNPLVKQAIESEHIIVLGQGGKTLLPTSSVRTLYHPKLPWFTKFSINVRLTNCIRKNAWYELDSAVQLTQILKPIRDKEQLCNPLFKVMVEPFATTLDLSSLASPEQDNYVIQAKESFGILYRENFHSDEIDIVEPTLAAALFAYDKQGNSQISKRIKEKAQQANQPYQGIARLWFERYTTCLLPGVFNYFFKHGVAFEPHLQNTLIGFDEGLPCCVYVRDLEGTKLLPNYWPMEKLSSLSERAQQSVYYSREAGWRRIGYCTLINNLSEAIFHLADGDNALEMLLWEELLNQLKKWQTINGEQPEINALISGGSLPSKNNFTTRLMKKADRESDYTQILSPWRHQRAETRGSVAP
ncbi:IucA/IucC family protein [Marinomonas spartinae]|uniref:IucA/IucC family protein n=1 Tax=Marinomonas spartinae TaxID=1792290 RepID=UPI0018F1ADD3|nr:IucA/IucC family protein [Marinomonas spartinae]MBJ7553987.1 hypothetical protein [Marinomonas spartinae]